jgi:hypothetical protein
MLYLICEPDKQTEDKRDKTPTSSTVHITQIVASPLTVLAILTPRPRQKIVTAFKHWLKEKGRPGHSYVVVQLKTRTVKVREEKQKVFEGF